MLKKDSRLSFLLTNGKWLASKCNFETTQNSEDFAGAPGNTVLNLMLLAENAETDQTFAVN